ncbi:MAG TPA: DNA replication/repair protein RecF [Clostridia bacterium]|nr:DNA replication/repair protein RecF [Clostridia bacterium]
MLHNFRNYGYQDIRLTPDVNVFYGPNGVGKTNIIEAVYYLSIGRSFRTTRDRDLVKWDAHGFCIYADLELYGKQKRFAVNYVLDGSKRISVDGKRAFRRYDGSGGQWPSVVVFSPQDLYIVKGPPASRRAFLDLLISRASKTYAKELWEYTRALNQRNALLRSQEVREEVYAIWEERLATTGSRIVSERQRFLAEISKSASRYYETLVAGAEELSMYYMIAGRDADGGLGGDDLLTATQATTQAALQVASQAKTQAKTLSRTEARAEATDPTSDVKTSDVKGFLFESLARNRAKERHLGNTIVGPHRDDVAFFVDSKDARVFGSQGQQRTVALSLRLAEVELLTKTTGEVPVLLLDDVISELDELRRSQLLRNVFSGGQVLITTTSLQDVVLWLKGSDESTPYGIEVFEVTSGAEGPVIRSPSGR